MNTLATHSSGQGKDLVFIHGWGLHGGVWNTIATQLAQLFRITVIDLPGFGRSPIPKGPYTLEAISEQLLQQLPADAIWIGWSLGGQFAAQAASRVPLRGFISVASTPKFVRDEHWPHATDKDLLNEFAAALVQDYRTTVQRFLAIQAIGSEKAREQIQLLNKIVFAHGEPSVQALEATLAILRDADLRPIVPDIRCPALLLFGSKDRMVPPQAGPDYAALLPNARVEYIHGAGHAPFISHPNEFATLITHFANEVFE